MRRLKSQWLNGLLILSLILGYAATVHAAEPSEKNSWEFGVEIYLWGASVGGETASGSELDVGFTDLLDDLELGFMGVFGARKNKWSFLVDLIYLDAKGEGTVEGIDGSVELTGWVVTPDAGYTVLEGDRGLLDVHVGARYLYLESDIRLGSAGIDVSDDIWDGIIGVRGRINLIDKLYVPYYLDIGTGDSEMTWQASVGLGYQFKHLDVVAGYRYLEWNFDDNPAFDNIDFNGPYAGVKFFF